MFLSCLLVDQGRRSDGRWPFFGLGLARPSALAATDRARQAGLSWAAKARLLARVLSAGCQMSNKKRPRPQPDLWCSCEIIDYLPLDPRGRYAGIDILRGVAVLSMLAANAAAGCLAQPHSFLFRVYGSFSAPLFVFLAGLMVPANARHPAPARRFLGKACRLLLIASLIDLAIWNILPFTSFDILYLIAFALPTTAMTLSQPLCWRIAACIATLLLGPLIAIFVPYNATVFEVGLCKAGHLTLAEHFVRLVRSLFLDGWFPITPWLGFALVGSLAFTHGGLVLRHIRLAAIIGGLLLGLGLALISLFPPLNDREGYSELFYPPGMAYIVSAAGFLSLATTWLPSLQSHHGLQAMALLGRHSLSIYVFHLIVIRLILNPLFPGLSVSAFLLLYLGLCISAWFFAKLLDRGTLRLSDWHGLHPVSRGPADQSLGTQRRHKERCR